MGKEKINFDTFLEIENKLEIKMGLIRSAERVPKSKKMLKLEVSFGDDDRRTVMTNIGSKFEPDDLEMIQLPFITNLESVEIMGVTSEAMIMVGESPNGEWEYENFTNGSKLL
jgi:methionine--tRNA ligase beta chain